MRTCAVSAFILSAGPVPEKEHSKFLCFFFPCRTGKLQWRHCIHGRMEPRASCATSARRSWISRSQESSVKTGSQTENQPQDLLATLRSAKCTLQFIPRSFPECGCCFSLLTDIVFLRKWADGRYMDVILVQRLFFDLLRFFSSCNINVSYVRSPWRPEWRRQCEF